jgi:hypothetical protein
MTQLNERPSIEIRFPEGVQEGNARYRLKDTLKPHVAVEIHKRPNGALIVCDKETIGPVLLLLGGLEGFQVTAVQQ